MQILGNLKISYWGWGQIPNFKIEFNYNKVWIIQKYKEILNTLRPPPLSSLADF